MPLRTSHHSGPAYLRDSRGNSTPHIETVQSAVPNTLQEPFSRHHYEFLKESDGASKLPLSHALKLPTIGWNGSAGRRNALHQLPLDRWSGGFSQWGINSTQGTPPFPGTLNCGHYKWFYTHPRYLEEHHHPQRSAFYTLELQGAQPTPAFLNC